MLFTVDTRLLLKYYNIHYNLLRSADLDSGARTIQNAVYVDLESHKIAFSYVFCIYAYSLYDIGVGDHHEGATGMFCTLCVHTSHAY